ncbi:hypothetical protein GYMLUDRAFT_148856 [Collybiopsis luxurians FD-317 M1]|nr:hypothetical protein GYMLUDRAFT_148856 [Collybiopsis luxurians FD-317 M1]
MAQDVASVRAEIKAWERRFLDEHGRGPTVDDIRENQPLANKYRLYKKLSKATPSEKLDDRKSTILARASTPPGKIPQSPSVLSKPRTLETTSALSSYNPFSPQKNKGKQREVPKSAKPRLPPSNPFATPSKTRPGLRVTESSPSPVHESAPALVLPQNLPPEPPTAVRRARKRLRGEPVSPSPHKDKRRRTRENRKESDSSDSDDVEDEAGNSSFVADSPVKGSSNFKSLFEDNSASITIKTSLTRTNTTSIPAGLFNPLRARSAVVEDDLESILGPVDIKPRWRPTSLSLSSKLVPGKDNLHTTRDPAPQLSQMTVALSKGESSEQRKLGKRARRDSDTEFEKSIATSSTSGLLIPPSPPPNESSSQRAVNHKVKGKAASRKKIKIEEDEEDDSLSEDGKVVIRRSQASGKSFGDDDLDIGSDFDPLFSYTRRPGHNEIGERERAIGTFEVDLPDKFRHVVALSASDTLLRDMQEEHVAESLIYGRRTTHYEPSKGGQIWNVGDVEGSSASDEIVTQRASTIIEDEDWEGEPVPWELGEL